MKTVAPASRPRFGEVIIRDRGRLPHWEKDSATYFITFRLADSLPHSVLEQIEFEKQDIVKTAAKLGRDLSPDERQRIAHLSTARVEQYLDNGSGACHLRKSGIAQLVSDALCHFDEKRYRLFAWCIMPNHVHAVLKLFPGYHLSDILHSWKSFTAKRAQSLTEIDGPFWQREYYDHLIRDEAEFERAVRYHGTKSNSCRTSQLALGLGARAGCPRDSRRDAGATFKARFGLKAYPEQRYLDWIFRSGIHGL